MPKSPTPAAIRKALDRIDKRTTDLAGRIAAATIDLARLEKQLLAVIRAAR